MTPDHWVDLFKFFGVFLGVLTVSYKGYLKWLETMKDRPVSDDSTPRMLAAILNKITDSLEKDAGARLGRMQEISSVLEKLAALQLGIAEGGIKSQNVTETLHKMTRDRIDTLGNIVSKDLGEIKGNQMIINATIERFGERLAGKRAA